MNQREITLAEIQAQKIIESDLLAAIRAVLARHIPLKREGLALSSLSKEGYAGAVSGLLIQCAAECARSSGAKKESVQLVATYFIEKYYPDEAPPKLNS